MIFKDPAPGQEPKPEALSPEEREKLTRENYYFSQKAAREEFGKLGLNPQEAIGWFDDKYGGYGDVPVLLRDQNGQPVGEKAFADISDVEKRDHSYGMLKLINDSHNLDFIEHFLNEPELLALADKKLNNLPRLVRLYRENKAKLSGE